MIGKSDKEPTFTDMGLGEVLANDVTATELREILDNTGDDTDAALTNADPNSDPAPVAGTTGTDYTVGISGVPSNAAAYLLISYLELLDNARISSASTIPMSAGSPLMYVNIVAVVERDALVHRLRLWLNEIDTAGVTAMIFERRDGEATDRACCLGLTYTFCYNGWPGTDWMAAGESLDTAAADA